MAPKASKNTRSSKRDVIYPPEKSLQDNIQVDSETEIESEYESEMSQNLFKITKTKHKKRHPSSVKEPKRIKYQYVF